MIGQSKLGVCEPIKYGLMLASVHSSSSQVVSIEGKAVACAGLGLTSNSLAVTNCPTPPVAPATTTSSLMSCHQAMYKNEVLGVGASFTPDVRLDARQAV